MISGGNYALGFAIFLVVVGFDDIADDGASGFAAMLAAFLNENGDANFRIASWRVADEPGIIFKFFLFAEAIPSVVTDDLRGAGFSAEFDIGNF